jgi:hypothetical protein
MNRHEQWLLRNARRFEPINGVPLVRREYSIFDLEAATGRWPQDKNERALVRTDELLLALKAAKPSVGDRYTFQDRSMLEPPLIWRVESSGTYEEVNYFKGWVDNGRWESRLHPNPASFEAIFAPVPSPDQGPASGYNAEIMLSNETVHRIHGLLASMVVGIPEE